MGSVAPECQHQVVMSAMVIVDQVCRVRTMCRGMEADEFVKAVVIETGGIHGVRPRPQRGEWSDCVHTF